MSIFQEKIIWSNETKINLYQNDGKRKVWKRKGTAHELNHTTSIKPLESCYSVGM